MTRNAIFVTGTDTGVGKTVASALILSALRQLGCEPTYFKPVQTGKEQDTDEAMRLSRTNHAHPPVYRFALPKAPWVAASAEGSEISLDRIERIWSKHIERGGPPTVVEGAGGLLVPLNPSETIANLIHRLRIPTIIVCSTRLGTINHTLLTLEAARSRQIPVAALILMGEPDPDLRPVLEAFSRAPVIAEIPRLSDLTAESIAQAAREWIPIPWLTQHFLLEQTHHATLAT
jgi:dethiobiotin synthase